MPLPPHSSQTQRWPSRQTKPFGMDMTRRPFGVSLWQSQFLAEPRLRRRLLVFIVLLPVWFWLLVRIEPPRSIDEARI